MENPIKGCHQFLTHHNYKRPYCVSIFAPIKQDSSFILFENVPQVLIHNTIFENDMQKRGKLTWALSNVSRVLVGKSSASRMTFFSGGIGSHFDGNTILIDLGKCMYMFVGNMIYTFKSFSPIVDFSAPVGNNDCPYPWACDEDGRYYLLICGTILNNMPTLRDDLNPYDWFYETRESQRNIKAKFGEEEDESCFHWPCTTKSLHDNYSRLISNFGMIQIRRQGNTEFEVLDETKYIELVDQIGHDFGFQHFDSHIIHITSSW